MPAELIRAEPLDTQTDPPCRFILPAPTTGWSQLALGVWELRQSEHGDCHPHDEVNYVLEGTLIVDCDGESVEARPGDVVRVPAASVRVIVGPLPAPTLGPAVRVLVGPVPFAITQPVRTEVRNP